LLASTCFGLTALVVGGLSAEPARAQSLGPLVQITGPTSPLAGCTADHPAQQTAMFGSTLYRNTAIEPSAAIDPTDSSRIMVAHQQDRWSDGGARGLTGNVSTNGGGIFNVTIPSGVTRCTGGSFIRASDPWITIGNNGTAFFMSLVLDPAASTTPFGARSGGMLVSRSRDHGRTWEPPTALIIDNTPLALNDKNSITADPTKNGTAYAVWDRLSIFPQGNEALPDAGDAGGDGVLLARDRVARLRAAAAGDTEAAAAVAAAPKTRGPTFLSLTADNGASWSRAASIYDPGVNAQTINNIVVVPPSGKVVDFFTNIDAAGNLNIGHIQSKDKGFSWSGPSFATDIQVTTVITPNQHVPIRDASILFSVTADTKTGALYLAWQDDRFNGKTGIDSIAFSQSLDGGATWSMPIKVNQTPMNSTNPLREQAFVPTVAVAGNGAIAVTYYDFRNDVNTQGVELADFFGVFCKSSSADCSKGANWGNEVRLTNHSFNMLEAPVARGPFLGDYMAMVSDSDAVWPVFGLVTGPDRTADFTRKITLSGGPVASAQ
jgi:hypothetical protein